MAFFRSLQYVFSLLGISIFALGILFSFELFLGLKSISTSEKNLEHAEKGLYLVKKTELTMDWLRENPESMHRAKLEVLGRDWEKYLESLVNGAQLDTGYRAMSEPQSHAIKKIIQSWKADAAPFFNSSSPTTKNLAHFEPFYLQSPFFKDFHESIRLLMIYDHGEIKSHSRRTALLNQLEFLVIFLLMVWAYFLIRSAKNDISQLLQASYEIGQGNLSYRIEALSSVEFSQMGNAMNHMADALQLSTLSRHEVSRILDSIPDAILVLNLSGQLLESNLQARKIFGKEIFSDAMGKFHLGDYLKVPSSDETPLETWELFEKTASVEGVLQTPHAQFPCYVTCSILSDKSDLCYGRILQFKDVSYFKAIEEEIEKQRTQSIAASKMATLGEMAAGVAHEINNPLAIISGYALRGSKMVGQSDLDCEKLQHLFAKMHTQTARISKIIQGLRSFARDGSVDKMQKVSVKAILDNVFELCGGKFAHQDVDLRLSMTCSILHLECRQVEIEQVLLNLVNNAYKAALVQEKKWVEIEADHKASNIIFSVTDSGPGIEEKIAKKIFEPFFTTREVGVGTGMGLSISQGIANAHRGTLTLDSKSRYTRFVLTLPCHQPIYFEQESQQAA